MPNTCSGIIIDDDHNWYNDPDDLDIRHSWVGTECMFCLQNLTNIRFNIRFSMTVFSYFQNILQDIVANKYPNPLL